jgi:ABC-type phosphate transport system substrate-binding protein
MLSKSFNRLAGRSARVGMLAALALVVIAAFGATSSNAAFTAPYTVKCTGSDVTGRGSSFQTVLQPALINYWKTNTNAGQTGGCGPAATQTISYQPLGSGAGRNAFGASGGPRDATIRYIAFDDAPTATQRAAMEAANPGDGGANPATGAGKFAVAPIGVGATTLIAHFPKDCELPAGDPHLAPYARFELSNAELEAAWVGDSAHDQWGEILPGIEAIPNNADGKDDSYCQNKPVIRVKRFDSSGTTAQFKVMLNAVNPATGWSALANTAWPNPGPNLTDGGSNGASAEATKVKNTDGSIGYADLATARGTGFQKAPDSTPSDPAAYVYNNSNNVSGYGAYNYNYSFNKSLFWIPLESATATNPTSGSGVFTEPTYRTTGIRDNTKGTSCLNVTFNNVPLNGSGAPDQFGDWSPVNGALTVGRYPQCVLTYVGFWQDYSDVYGTSATEQAKARTVHDFIETSVYSGQNILASNDYSRLPSDLQRGSQTAILDSYWLHP